MFNKRYLFFSQVECSDVTLGTEQVGYICQHEKINGLLSKSSIRIDEHRRLTGDVDCFR